jgi:hypothetical protein
MNLRPSACRAGRVAALVTLGSVGLACVGGSGSVPGQVIGGEASSGQGSTGTDTVSGDTSGDSKKPSTNNSPAPTEGPSAEVPDPAGCQAGLPCDCGSTKLVGTYTCPDGGKPTCSCKPVP